MNNLLLLSAICSASAVVKTEVPTVDLKSTSACDKDVTKPDLSPDANLPGGGEDQKIPLQDSFKVSGPINGVCSSEFNSHPMVMKDPLDTETILG